MIKCADDYALNESVDRAVLNLVAAGKLDAVSVLVKKLNPQNSRELAAFSNQVKIGIHLDLFPVLKCFFSRKKAELEIEAQINLFYANFGFYPHFYDGHMHCHIYPIVRTALLTRLQPLTDSVLFVRSLSLKPELTKTKKLSAFLYLKFLLWLNRAFKKQLKVLNIPTNDYIYGVFHHHMSFKDVLNFAMRFKSENSILFFHPGLDNDQDLLRKSEYELFSKI